MGIHLDLRKTKKNSISHTWYSDFIYSRTPSFEIVVSLPKISFMKNRPILLFAIFLNFFLVYLYEFLCWGQITVGSFYRVPNKWRPFYSYTYPNQSVFYHSWEIHAQISEIFRNVSVIFGLEFLNNDKY